MKPHSHDFVNTYKGLVALGLNRETDENTIVYYLQKFSDDHLMEYLKKKLTDEDIERIFSLISSLLKKYLTEKEYHNMFLKDDFE